MEHIGKVDEALLDKLCRGCGGFFPGLFLKEHQEMSCPGQLESSNSNAETETTNIDDGAGGNEASANPILLDDIDESLLDIPCEGCGGMFPGLFYLLEHQEFSCPGQNENISSNANAGTKNLDDGENQTSANPIPLGDEDESLVDIACNMCHKLYPAFGMKEHQTVCTAQKESVDSSDKFIKRSTDDATRRNLPKRETNLLQTKGNSHENNNKNEERKNNSEKNVKRDPSEKTFMPSVSDAEFLKDYENEKHGSSEFPSNPLFKYAEQSDEDDLNISDDDCGESLEDFWLRAKEQLKRQRFQKNLS